MSKRKYHFIIPIDTEWSLPLEDDAFDSQSHVLHGLIHCNGFGHLLCINTDLDDPNHLSGDQIMDFWDRLCSTLHTRYHSLFSSYIDYLKSCLLYYL